MPAIDPVVNGDAEFGLTSIAEVLAAPGVDLVGPLPAEIQSFIVYAAAIPKQAKERAAAKALVDFLVTPRVASVLKSIGLDRD